MTHLDLTAPDPTAAIYVFAVCRRTDDAVLARLPGITGALVRALPFERLRAVVQDVPAPDADRRTWTGRLSDPAELERCVRAHHQVVTAVADGGPTVPMALATLYGGDERARQALSADAARFHTALDRISGRDEWGVKVYAPAPDRTAAPATPAGPPPSGAGRAYLERVRGAHRAREEGHRAALLSAEEVDEALRGLAVAARRLRPHAQQPADDRRTQVLNAAYLVEQGRASSVAETVAELRRRTGALIELSGPWVPYSFAGVAGEEQGDEGC